jgi:RNA:NAD 2'-phosphotransferase (TPT1/KptA family)
MFGMSRIPRPSNSLLESSMSLLLWHSQESNSVLLLREGFAIIDEIRDGLKQASFLSDADSMMKFREMMASALDEESSIL